MADGVFHVATWVSVMAGSIAAIKAWREGRFDPSWSFHFGLVLAGWGIFNLVEGIVDHHLLGVHHVRDDVGSLLSWDVGFLAFGALLVAGGWLLHKRGLAAMGSRAPGSKRVKPPPVERTDLSPPGARDHVTVGSRPAS